MDVEIGRQAEQAVRHLLESMGEVHASPTDSGADFVLDLPDGSRHLFQVKAYTSIRPSDRAVNSRPPPGMVRVVVAPRISEGAARSLEEMGLSWLALDGPARIMAPGLQLRVLGQARERSRSRALSKELNPGAPSSLASLSWTPVLRDVAEYLLTLVPPEASGSIPLPKTVDIAEVVGHSQAAAAKSMRAMASMGWVDKKGPSRGRGSQWQLLDPTGLLDDWSSSRSATQEWLAHGLIGDPLDFARSRLRSVLPTGSWCLAATSASQLISPELTATPVLECGLSTEVVRRMEFWLEKLDLRLVERGHRLRFRAFPDVTFATAQNVGGLAVTSTPRTYLDLLREPGRSAQVAASIRETVLGY